MRVRPRDDFAVIVNVFVGAALVAAVIAAAL